MQIFIPQKLIDLRKKCCLSQDELAKQIGVSRTLVTKWETGKSVPTQDAISSMCSALKCDYNDLTEKSIDEFYLNIVIRKPRNIDQEGASFFPKVHLFIK